MGSAILSGGEHIATRVGDIGLRSSCVTFAKSVGVNASFIGVSCVCLLHTCSPISNMWGLVLGCRLFKWGWLRDVWRT